MSLHPDMLRARRDAGMPVDGMQRLRAPPANAIDALLDPSTGTAACHEIYARTVGDAAAATGLALGIAAGWRRERPLLWVRQTMADLEAGQPYTQGVSEFGLDPSKIVLVIVRDAIAALQAGLEGAHSKGLGAVLVELWGKAPAYDLTASRRLALACKSSAVPLVVARCAADPAPSAAETRWQATAALSTPLAANAPGNPAFLMTLLRHRAGLSEGAWRLEWNRDNRRFTCHRFQDSTITTSGPPLSGAVVAVSFERPYPAQPRLARTG